MSDKGGSRREFVTELDGCPKSVVEERQELLAAEKAAEANVARQKECVPSAGDDAVSAAELALMQAEKIAAIRRAIAAGAYDTDELLEKAMARMLRRIDECDSAQ